MTKISIYVACLLLLVASSCSKESGNVVAPEENTNIEVTDIKFTTNGGKAFIGGTVQLTAFILPENATNKKIKYESNNHNVATVDQNGLVTTYKSGIVEIRASSESGNKSTSYVMDVSMVQVNEISIGHSGHYDIVAGASRKIEVTVLPENSENPALNWQVVNSEIAEINNEGIITGIKKGITAFTATSVSNPSIKKEFSVEVFESPNDLIKLTLTKRIFNVNNAFVTADFDLVIDFGTEVIVTGFKIKDAEGLTVINRPPTNSSLSSAARLVRDIKLNNVNKPSVEITYVHNNKSYTYTAAIQ